MSSINEALKMYRLWRGFNAEDYLIEKLAAINKFFTNEKLDSAVIGISGGIDSAVAFYLLHKASEQPGSPIKKILPISIPIHSVKGVTGQVAAASKAQKVVEKLGYEYYEVNLSDAYNAIVKSSMPPLNDTPDERNWAEGQMASVLRTPVLYYHAALLQTGGLKSIVVGTTNRDEGSYIGFFGKASDAMVDLQPIGDMHKSEVYKVAELLEVPLEIIQATPKGDVWDNRVDEQMIGAPYHILELFLLEKEHGGSVKDILTGEEKEYYLKCVENIEKLHQTNLHKYKVGNPARFIDVMPRRV